MLATAGVEAAVAAALMVSQQMQGRDLAMGRGVRAWCCRERYTAYRETQTCMQRAERVAFS